METIRSNKRFNEKQGQLLVKLARNTILKELGGKSTNAKSDTSILAFQDERFQAHYGTFVTLKIQGQLRGCIGNLTPEESVLEGVKRNAVNAPVHCRHQTGAQRLLGIAHGQLFHDIDEQPAVARFLLYC